MFKVERGVAAVVPSSYQSNGLIRDIALHPPGVNQFHQQFTLEQLFHTKMFCAAILYLTFWFVIFWQKEIGKKAAHKMLVKLTICLYFYTDKDLPVSTKDSRGKNMQWRKMASKFFDFERLFNNVHVV